MSTTFMVKSNLVYLVCHINLVLMTMQYLFSISKSTAQDYILSALHAIIYVTGLLFNVYVILYAGRKWELVMKYLRNSASYLSLVHQEIKYNVVSSTKGSKEFVLSAVSSLMESFRHLYSEESRSVINAPAEGESLANNHEESISKLMARPIGEEAVGRVDIAPVFRNETVENVQSVSEDKTPEFKLYNLRSVSRPKSDPVRKAVKAQVFKPESPELLKNKIFKARMSLTCNSPCARMDKRHVKEQRHFP